MNVTLLHGADAGEPLLLGRHVGGHHLPRCPAGHPGHRGGECIHRGLCLLGGAGIARRTGDERDRRVAGCLRRGGREGSGQGQDRDHDVGHELECERHRGAGLSRGQACCDQRHDHQRCSP